MLPPQKYTRSNLIIFCSRLNTFLKGQLILNEELSNETADASLLSQWRCFLSCFYELRTLPLCSLMRGIARFVLFCLKMPEGAIFVCGHRPKTKELLELFLFTIWFISSLKGIKVKTNFSLPGNRIEVLLLPSQALCQLICSTTGTHCLDIFLFILRISKTTP